MAKLSAHGREIGRIHRVDHTVAYFSDRTVLINRGFGWKIQCKVKAELDPVEVFNRKNETYNTKLAENPAFKRWRDLIVKEPLYPQRLRLVTALELLHDDLDGLYSELDDSQDTRGRWSVEDLKEISDAYTDAMREAEEKKASVSNGRI